MKQTITFSQFHDGFDNRRDNFSYAGLRALFDWFENYDADSGTETEFDPIAICCEYTEYADLEEYNDDYSASNCPDIESINYYTTVILIDDTSFIIADF